jgi:lipopolysaccharide export system protein LptA
VDTGNKLTINILHANNFINLVTDSGSLDKLIGDVVLQQGGDTLYSDSTFLNMKTNNLEAFGDVKIAQPGGTQALSDYLRYTSNKKLAYMSGNVSLTDATSKLWCQELTYDVGTKTGVYDKGGTLQSDATTVSSNGGVYNVKTKDVHFTGNVLVTDPQYNIHSEDMLYNTDTKLTTFYPPHQSVVTGDKSIIHTTQGTYDSKNKHAHLTNHSSVIYGDQYIEADTIDYDKLTGYDNATGHVISIDTTQHSTLYCGRAEYYEKTKKLWATIKPVLKQMDGSDSLFIRADSFFSAPVPKKADTVKNRKGEKTTQSEIKKTEQKGKEAENKIAGKNMDETDTTADSSAPRYYIGFHRVLIFSDSLQGKCDSISYTQNDSNMRMMYNPIAWSHNSQITGDTIIMHMDSGKLKRIFVPNNALLVSQSGPVKAQLFDQVQGKTLTAYFVNNNIEHMVVHPNAESIHYSQNDKNEYLGVSQAQGEQLSVFFNNKKVIEIKYEDDVTQTMTPLEKADLPNMRLSRFKWLISSKPKSRKQLFE